MLPIRAVLLLSALVVVACQPNGEAPERPVSADFPECPNEQDLAESSTVGPEGGSVSVAGHRLEVPAGAVREPVRFEARLRESRTLQLDLLADQRESFRFEQPARLSLATAACAPDLDHERLRVYRIDPASNRILAELQGEFDPRARTITARLDSLSTYTIGIHH
jgi:hypothetical protein